MGDEKNQLRCRLGQARGIANSVLATALILMVVLWTRSASDQFRFAPNANATSASASILPDGGALFTFLRDVADATDFQPRWQTETWSEPHAWFYISSTFANSAACFFLAAVLARIYRMHSATSYAKLALLFCVFFLSGGIAHLLE